MNPRQIQSEHYLKALIIVLSLYVGSFVYLELTTVKKEEMLSTEGLYEVQLEEITEAEKEEIRQELQLQQQRRRLGGRGKEAICLAAFSPRMARISSSPTPGNT